MKSIQLDTNLKVTSEDHQLIFKNLNKIAYYENQAKLAEIARAEKQRNLERELDLLESYVSNFGVQNFYKNTEMIWKLGQLYEIMGEEKKAKSVFRLVLKHSRKDLKRIQFYFDSITVNDREYYVPLKYYYELVEYRKTIDTLRPPLGVLTNMGKEVNSKLEDYAPSMNFKGDTLYFTSKRNSRGAVNMIQNEDIYYTTGIDGYWEDAIPVKEINSGFNEGSVCINSSGTEMYFARCNSPDGYGDCDIFISKKLSDGKWGPSTNLGVNVNSKVWDSQPSLSHTGDTLYFASDRIGGFGLSDIYYCVRQPDGTFGFAQNIGPIINTRDNEVSPFIHHKYNVLYFSSRGQLMKFGDFDIYKSRWLVDHWDEPRNVGPLVNSPGSEFYFTIDPQSKFLFYSHSEPSDKKDLDLYSFPLPMEAQPLAYTKFEGSLVDSVTNDPFSGIVTIVDMSAGTEVAPKFLRPDGSFDFDLINERDYMLIIQGSDFFRVEKRFTLNGDTVMKIKTPSIKFKKLQFTSIVFETGKANILPTMNNDLDKIFNYMVDNPTIKLKISGHTDSDGDSLSHIRLSQRRAEAIKNYITNGELVEPDRIEAIGYGNTKPLIKEEKTEEDKKINRRVEFEIIRPKEKE